LKTKSGSALFYWKSLSRADRLHSNRFDYPVNWATVIIILYLSFFPITTRKIASFTVKWSVISLHSTSRDGMSIDDRKMLPIHVTLKADVKDIKF